MIILFLVVISDMFFLLDSSKIRDEFQILDYMSREIPNIPLLIILYVDRVLLCNHYYISI